MNKHILSEEQLIVLDRVHKKIIEGALIRMGIPYEEHENFIKTSKKTFDILIEEAQKTLAELNKK